MNFFIATQIDENGSETGNTKLIKGTDQVIKFILKDEDDQHRKDVIKQSIEKMSPGDFDAINSGKYIYEVDCLSEKDASELSVDDNDFINEEKTAVFEIFKEEKTIDYAFGLDDLKKKLQDNGLSKDVSDNAWGAVSTANEASFELTDPEHVHISVKKLDDREVEKLQKTNSAFALDYEMFGKEKVNENSENQVKSVEIGNFVITISELCNGKFIFDISTKNGKFISQGSFFKTAEEAENYAKSSLETDEFKNDMALKESTEDETHESYCGHEIKTNNSNGMISTSVNKNGFEKTFKKFRAVEEAVKFAKFAIDSGMNESSEEIIFDVSIAEKAYNAICDNPYLKNNVEWTATNAMAFSRDENDEDDSILDEIEEQLKSAGIKIDEYFIEKKD